MSTVLNVQISDLNNEHLYYLNIFTANKKQDLDNAEDKADSKLEKGEKQLKEAYQKLIDAEKEIDENEQKIKDAEVELADAIN